MAIPLIIDPQTAAVAATSCCSDVVALRVSRKRSRCDTCLPTSPSSSNKKQRTTTTASTASTKPKKSVRFHDLVLVCSVERIDEIDAPNVWYSKSDFLQAKRRDQRMVRDQLAAQQQHEQHEQQQSQSSSSSSSIFCDALVDVLEATTSGTASPSQIKQSCTIVSQGPLRGLEREILPCFRLRKRQVVANVLKSQATLKAWKVMHPEAPADHTSLVLASHCRKLAQPSQRFARLLGVGDALAAI